MKSRSREVNIFNMSLLDILCGALGAFCFLTLVLFPAYQKNAEASGGYVGKLEEELKKTRAELEQARSQLISGASGDTKQLMEQLKQTEAAWHDAEARARDSDSKLQQSRAEADKLTARLDMGKMPMFVTAMWGQPDAEVAMYVRSPGKTENGKSAPPFEPNKERQETTFSGQTWFSWSGHEMWLTRDVLDGEHEIYYRVIRRGDPKQPLQVSARYGWEGFIGTIPPVTFDGNRKSAFVGKVVRSGDKLEFRPAAGGQQ